MAVTERVVHTGSSPDVEPSRFTRLTQTNNVPAAPGVFGAVHCNDQSTLPEEGKLGFAFGPVWVSSAPLFCARASNSFNVMPVLAERLKPAALAFVLERRNVKLSLEEGARLVLRPMNDMLPLKLPPEWQEEHVVPN